MDDTPGGLRAERQLAIIPGLSEMTHFGQCGGEPAYQGVGQFTLAG